MKCQGAAVMKTYHSTAFCRLAVSYSLVVEFEPDNLTASAKTIASSSSNCQGIGRDQKSITILSGTADWQAGSVTFIGSSTLL